MAHYSRRGAEISLIAPDFSVYALTDGTRRLCGAPGAVLSVFCFGARAEDVTIAGDVFYPASHVTLTDDVALGVSNELTGPEAEISVGRGTLLIFLYTSPASRDL
jgi:thiamine pyrophosphokinase